jgi:Tol biopolymer transport system component
MSLEEGLMRRSWIAVAVLALALGGGELLAGKGGGGKKPPPDEPPPDPAVAYELGDDLYVMNDDGSNVNLLLTAEEAGGSIRYPTWSPDGTQLAFLVHGDSSTGLYALEVSVDSGGVSGSGLTYLTNTGDYGVWGLSWSPEAIVGVERIVFSEVVNGNALTHLFLVNADGSGDRVDLDRHGGFGVSWSPTGDRIAVGSRLSGLPLRVHTLAVGSDGEIYVDTRRYDVGGTAYYPAWSRTQNDVLVVSVPNPNYTDLWQIDLADAVETSDGLFLLNDHVSLTNTTNQDDLYASWSPDDTQIVWRQAGRGGTDGLHVLQVDGSEDPELLLKDSKRNKPFRPAWR